MLFSIHYTFVLLLVFFVLFSFTFVELGRQNNDNRRGKAARSGRFGQFIQKVQDVGRNHSFREVNGFSIF